MKKDFLIIGLGNPGKQYEDTRHNVGKRMVERWAAMIEASGIWKEQSEWPAQTMRFSLPAVPETGVTALLPLTYMNTSGEAVAKFLTYQELPLEQILIVHDELELPLGEIQFSPGRSARGHRGVKSIQESLGAQNIPRLQVGIGRPESRQPLVIEQYVLGIMPEAERALLDTEVFPRVSDRLESFIRGQALQA